MIPSHRLKRAKRSLRRDVLARRDSLPQEERAERSRRIADLLLALPELGRARTVMAFSSFGSEVDTAPVLQGLADRQIRLALPRIQDGDIVPVAYRPGDPVDRATFGALQPSAGEQMDAEEIDVVITPGVAFDPTGSRVGYGGGFYDRFFGRTRADAFRVAIGFALQVMPTVPRGLADEPVDAVVTEDGVIRRPRR